MTCVRNIHRSRDSELATGLVDPADYIVGREARIEDARGDEIEEALQVEAVGRHAKDELALALRRVTVGTGVADRTVEPDLVEAEAAPLRDADRQIMSLFEQQPQRRVSTGQHVRTDLWQHLEYFVGRKNAADGVEQRSADFAADGPILEVLLGR